MTAAGFARGDRVTAADGCTGVVLDVAVMRGGYSGPHVSECQVRFDDDAAGVTEWVVFADLTRFTGPGTDRFGHDGSHGGWCRYCQDHSRHELIDGACRMCMIRFAEYPRVRPAGWANTGHHMNREGEPCHRAQ